MCRVTNRAFPFLAALASLGLMGCLAPQADLASSFDKTVDFASLKTFAWLANTNTVTGVSGGEAAALKVQLKGAIERELMGKGYSGSGEADPDFLVVYDLEQHQGLGLPGIAAASRQIANRRGRGFRRRAANPDAHGVG